MKKESGFPRRVTGAAAACCLAMVAVAADPPESALNPLSGAIETTDASWTGTNYNVRHVITSVGTGEITVFVVASHTADDNSPRLAIDGSDGDTWVAWWRDESNDGVFVRKRAHASGTWSSEARLSTTSVSARHPELVAEGTGVRLVWEEGAAGGTRSIAVTGIVDDPDPCPNVTIVGQTSFSGDLDSTIRRESGTTWVTWVDSTTQVGWSKWTGSSWTGVAYESYASDTVEAARGRVRGEVLANP